MGYHVALPNKGQLPPGAGTNARDEAWAELMATRLNPPGTAVIPSKWVTSAGALP